MSDETVLSALESARLEPPGDEELDEEFDTEPDWEKAAEEREELREARWERD